MSPTKEIVNISLNSLCTGGTVGVMMLPAVAACHGPHFDWH